MLLALRESEDLDEIIRSTFRWELVSSGEGTDTSYVAKKKYLLIICSSYNTFGVKNADYEDQSRYSEWLDLGYDPIFPCFTNTLDCSHASNLRITLVNADLLGITVHIFRSFGELLLLNII